MGDNKEEYTQEYLDKQAAAKQWIEELIEEQIGDDLSESLQDGIILCKLISELCPTLEISIISKTPHNYIKMENISTFLEGCNRLGFQNTELFAPPDLFEKKNMNKVLDTLKKIADYAAKYDFPVWKGPTTQFSRTERRSIIGGDVSKAVPPKAPLPPKKIARAPLKRVRTLPLIVPPNGAKPALQRPTPSQNEGSPNLRPDQPPSTSSNKETPKEQKPPPQRVILTGSRELPRRDVASSSDNVQDKPDTPKPVHRLPFDVQIGSNKPTIQETSPREEVVYISLPPPRTPPPYVDSPKAAATHPKPLPTVPHEPTKISHVKSKSSGGLQPPTDPPSSSSSNHHGRSKSHTVAVPQSSTYNNSPSSTSPPNISKMSSFKRVQEELFLEEDIQKKGLNRSQNMDKGEGLKRSQNTENTSLRDSGRTTRPASLSQPAPRNHISPEPKDDKRSEKRPERRSGNYSDSSTNTERERSDPRPEPLERRHERRSGNYSDTSTTTERPDRTDRPDRPDRRYASYSDATTNTERERAEPRPDLSERRHDRKSGNYSDTSTNTERPDRPDRADRPDRPDRRVGNYSDSSTNTERQDRQDRPDRPDRRVGNYADSSTNTDPRLEHSERRPERRSGNYSDTSAYERSEPRSPPRAERPDHSDRSRPERRSGNYSDTSERRWERPDRPDRPDRADRPDRRDKMDDRLQDFADGFRNGDNFKAAQELENQLRHTSNPEEREALQRKISLLVSEQKLAEYLSQLPRSREPLNPPSFSKATSPPPPPANPPKREKDHKKKDDKRSSISDVSSLSSSPPSSSEPIHLDRHRRQEHRRSLPPLSSSSPHAGSHRAHPPAPSPPLSSPPPPSDASTWYESTSSVPRSKTNKRSKRNTIAFPPPLPPVLPLKHSPELSSFSESDSSLSSFSSSSVRRPHAATAASLSPPAPPPKPSHSPTHSGRGSPHSLPGRIGGNSPKNARRPTISSDTFSPDRVAGAEHPVPQPPPSSSVSPSPNKFGSISRITTILTREGDNKEASMETQVQRLDELLRSTTDGSSMLHLASRHNYVQVVAFLLQCGEDPNAQDKQGKTPLHVAAALGNREIIDLLLAAGAQINKVDDTGSTPLQRAAERNQPAAVSKIVSVPGVKIDTLRNQDGWTPLYTSSHQGNFDNVSMLLTYHADPNVQNSEGWTPLHAACHQGHYKVVKLLVKTGANLNVLSKQGTTPLFHAVEKDHVEIAKYLGELGANVDLSKNFGWKPIHMAVYRGSYDSTSWLVSKGARLNELVRDTNLKGYTPLHILVSSDWLSESSQKNLELLYKSGASLLTKDDSGATPLHLAAYWDNVDAVKIITKFVKDDDIIYDLRDNNGETASDIAAWYGNLQVLKLLPRNSTQAVKYNPQTTGKMLPPLPPPLPPAPKPSLASPHEHN